MTEHDAMLFAGWQAQYDASGFVVVCNGIDVRATWHDDASSVIDVDLGPDEKRLRILEVPAADAQMAGIVYNSSLVAKLDASRKYEVIDRPNITDEGTWLLKCRIV